MRAELDAYYAYLYGLSKKELRYILDPKDVMGEDYPSETFRVLKENERIREFGEYRTQRLVLEAYDRFARDGTFDPARLEDPEYFPVVREALAAGESAPSSSWSRALQGAGRAGRSRAAADAVRRGRDRHADRRGGLAGAVSRASRCRSRCSPRAARPDEEPRPPGKAMRELLGDRLVMALADNDAEGRALSDEGNLHKGGVWKPPDQRRALVPAQAVGGVPAVMDRFQIPGDQLAVHDRAVLPARRSAARRCRGGVRRRGPQGAEPTCTRDPRSPRRSIGSPGPRRGGRRLLLPLAPSPRLQGRLRRLGHRPCPPHPANFAAFETVLIRLKELLAQPRPNGRQPPQKRQTA